MPLNIEIVVWLGCSLFNGCRASNMFMTHELKIYISRLQNQQIIRNLKDLSWHSILFAYQLWKTILNRKRLLCLHT